MSLSNDGAVLVLGKRESGKSTTLAWLATEVGALVISDDLVVLDHGQVLPGPRCIDLRGGANGLDGQALEAEWVRSTSHLRLTLPAVANAYPVAGTALLRWGDRFQVSSVPLDSRIELLSERRSCRALPADARALLDLAALPMIIVTRPKDSRFIPATANAVMNHRWY